MTNENETPKEPTPEQVAGMLKKVDDALGTHITDAIQQAVPGVTPVDEVIKMITGGNLGSMELAPVVQDLTQFNMEDLIPADSQDIHKVPSGRVYRRVATRDGSRLMMAANLEPAKQSAKTGGFWLAMAVVIRFIVVGDDNFPELKTRNSDDAMDQTVHYKDKIVIPFALNGGPIYAARIWKERNVTQYTINALSGRVPMAEVPAMISILDALIEQVPADDPIKLEVIG